MEWTDQDTQALRAWRNMIDSDNIKIKEKIKVELLNNKSIIRVIANKELEAIDAEPEDYYGVNIFPYYNIYATQDSTQSFVCFDTSFEMQRYATNPTEKQQQIYFYILCHVKDIKDRDTGLARHDLLAALITDQFNWTNKFGKDIHLVSDRPYTVDNDYILRTLVFQQITYNNLVKSTNKLGVPRLANKDIVL